MIRAAYVWPVALAACLGCGTWEAAPPTEQAATTQTPATPPSTPPSTPARPTAAAPARPPAAPAKPASSDQRSAPKKTPATPPATTQHKKLRKATVGVGRKGHGYGGGIYTAPLQARFRIEERIDFDTVTYALKLFKAEHGRLPKSNDEFMAKIIRANQISLPSLPAGDEYWYDAEKGQLMVRRGK